MGEAGVSGGGLLGWALASLLLSMRIAPVLGFAPPFTLMRVPAAVRLLLGLGFAGLITAWRPEAFAGGEAVSGGWFVAAAARELFVGSVFVLGLQLMFAALQLAGRTVDVQAGFGLAGLIDPTSSAQSPLVGALLTYAAGAVFFALDGHVELMRILAVSVDAVPIGTATPPADLGRLITFLGAVMAISFGVVGGAILALFLTDMMVAVLARTAPQINALMLGLQVKALLVLLVLPVSAGVWGALLTRLARVTLESLPGLIT